MPGPYMGGAGISFSPILPELTPTGNHQGVDAQPAARLSQCSGSFECFQDYFGLELRLVKRRVALLIVEHFVGIKYCNQVILPVRFQGSTIQNGLL